MKVLLLGNLLLTFSRSGFLLILCRSGNASLLLHVGMGLVLGSRCFGSRYLVGVRSSKSAIRKQSNSSNQGRSKSNFGFHDNLLEQLSWDHVRLPPDDFHLAPEKPSKPLPHHYFYVRFAALMPRSRKALLTTLRDERLMAAAAIIGDKTKPNAG